MVSLKFHDKVEKNDFIEVRALDKEVIYIIITSDDYKSVVLDKSTAIKLSKELRKQIALLD